MTVIDTSLVLYLFPLPTSFNLISIKDHDQLRNMKNKAHYYFAVKNNLVVSYGSLVRGNGIENKSKILNINLKRVDFSLVFIK